MNMSSYEIRCDSNAGGRILVQLTGEGNLYFNTVDSGSQKSHWVMMKTEKTIELVGAIGERVSRETKMEMIRELARQVAEEDCQ